MANNIFKMWFSRKERQADLGGGRVGTKLIKELEGLGF
jgi:hypothetical protein